MPVHFENLPRNYKDSTKFGQRFNDPNLFAAKHKLGLRFVEEFVAEKGPRTIFISDGSTTALVFRTIVSECDDIAITTNNLDVSTCYGECAELRDTNRLDPRIAAGAIRNDFHAVFPEDTYSNGSHWTVLGELMEDADTLAMAVSDLCHEEGPRAHGSKPRDVKRRMMEVAKDRRRELVIVCEGEKLTWYRSRGAPAGILEWQQLCSEGAEARVHVLVSRPAGLNEKLQGAPIPNLMGQLPRPGQIPVSNGYDGPPLDDREGRYCFRLRRLTEQLGKKCVIEV